MACWQKHGGAIMNYHLRKLEELVKLTPTPVHTWKKLCEDFAGLDYVWQRCFSHPRYDAVTRHNGNRDDAQRLLPTIPVWPTNIPDKKRFTVLCNWRHLHDRATLPLVAKAANWTENMPSDNTHILFHLTCRNEKDELALFSFSEFWAVTNSGAIMPIPAIPEIDIFEQIGSDKPLRKEVSGGQLIGPAISALINSLPKDTCIVTIIKAQIFQTVVDKKEKQMLLLTAYHLPKSWDWLKPDPEIDES